MREIVTQISENGSQTKQMMSTNAKWNWGTENTPVYTVVSAVVEVEGVEPFELPLYETINPKALNNLFTSRPGTAIETVSFQYAGYDVVVRGDGKVRVQSTSEV